MHLLFLSFYSCLPSRSKPEKLLWRIFHKIVALNVKLTRKRQCPRTHLSVFGVIGGGEFLELIFRVILDNDFLITISSLGDTVVKDYGEFRV